MEVLFDLYKQTTVTLTLKLKFDDVVIKYNYPGGKVRANTLNFAVFRRYSASLRVNLASFSRAFSPFLAGIPSERSLGSRPSPYVRVLIARGWANRSSGKAWDDSSREA